MTTQDKVNVSALITVTSLFALLIISIDSRESIKTERDSYKAQCDSINNNFNIYKSNIEATLDTCFIIGKSSHKIQKYIRE